MASVEAPLTGRQFTILIVEDDREVRDVVVEILSAKSFKVLSAGNGYEAIRILVAFPVDVLFADIILPGISGYELAAQARLMQPFVRVLYTTGFDGDAPGREMASSYGDVIRKPIRANELVLAVEGVLRR